jgi:hypothetical protein
MKFLLGTQASSTSMAQVEEQAETEIVKGYTMTQVCDKMIDLFLNEKTKSKEWRKYLVFREEWKKYRDSFFTRCQRRADIENDTAMKEKITSLGRRLKKVTFIYFYCYGYLLSYLGSCLVLELLPRFCLIRSKALQIDDEMEGHYELLKEIQDFPTDINAIVARRRKDFTGEFFRYLSLIADTYDNLEDRDGNRIQVFYFLFWLFFS